MPFFRSIPCLLLLLGGCAGDGATLDPDIVGLEREIDGLIGAYAIEAGSSEPLLAHRADERFALASTFKPLLAAAVLAAAADGRLSLDQRISTDGVEIQPHSPVTGPLGPGETLAIEELAAAAVTISDNTATNLLLERVGGPQGLTAFLRAHGDEVTRLDRWEVALNENARGDVRDTSTPRAVAQSFLHFVVGDGLEPEHRRRLAGWLVDSRTGLERLRAGLPDDWRVGDKTGFGANGAVNNVAVAWPPDGPPLVIAVYLSWTDADVATLNAVHARIAALAAARR